jgi:hypothetical protein
MQRWQVGTGAHSLNPEEILRVIIRVSLNEPLSNTFSLASRQAFEQEFNSRVMLGNFMKLISQEPPPQPANRRKPEQDATLCRHA